MAEVMNVDSIHKVDEHSKYACDQTHSYVMTVHTQMSSKCQIEITQNNSLVMD